MTDGFYLAMIVFGIAACLPIWFPRRRLSRG
jgi:hypothetical protein